MSTMHLLCHFDTPDFAAWKSAFDDDAEDRRLAGLTLLQMWRSADRASAVVCLFEVNDRAKAEDWVAKETGFGAALTPEFLRIA
jgi:hypothetical protein